MEPFNYSAQLQTPSFADSLTRGFGAGVAIQDRQLQQQQMQLQQQQAQAEMQQKAEQQRQLQAFADNPNPTAEDYAKITRAMPQLAEHFKKSWDILQPAQQDAKWKRTVSTYAALQSDKPGAAAQILNEHADALENSGDTEEAKTNRDLAKLAESDPVYAKKLAFLSLNSVDPERAAKLSSTLDSQAKNAAELPGQIADSKTKQVTAKYADSQALLDLEKKGWDIKGIQADIGFKKESNRIAAMNAAANRESNGLKRQELQMKIDDAKVARDQKIQDRVADATGAIAKYDNILNTLDQVKNHPGLKKSLGFASNFPTVAGSDAADFEALSETLGSQTFLTQVDQLRGLGSMTETEGAQLRASAAALGKKQSVEQYTKNLADFERRMENARSGAVKKFGAPESIAGGGTVLSSPKYGDLNEAQVREFAKAKGLTRDQAIQVIKSVQ